MSIGAAGSLHRLAPVVRSMAVAWVERLVAPGVLLGSTRCAALGEASALLTHGNPRSREETRE